MKKVTYQLPLQYTMKREVVPFRDYYWQFYEEQTEKVREKIDYVLQIIRSVDRVPEKFLKHLGDGLYEVRIKQGSNIYRIFSFFDSGQQGQESLVILLHGFQKKSQKTPKKELERARTLRAEYYEEKGIS